MDSYERRNLLSIRLAGVQRLLMCNLLSGALPLYIVTEYPKSGGSWVAQMLSAYLEVPFPRNVRPAIRSSIMHGHYGYSRWFRNVFVVLRDGRDVMVSLYYHLLFPNERNHHASVESLRRRLNFSDFGDIRANLPAFMQYVFEVHDARPFHHTWPALNRRWQEHGATFIKYEDLLRDPAQVMSEAIVRVTGRAIDRPRIDEIAGRFNFANQARRKPGEENQHSFLRKGVSGDWRDKFSMESRQLFQRLAGSELILFGYESNDEWTRRESGPVPVQ